MMCNTRSPKKYELVAPKQEESVKNNGDSDLQRDPFEDLCDELLCHILSFLPTIKNIAQLSLLSRRWLHLWSTYPYLDFFEVQAPASLQQLPEIESYSKNVIQSSFSLRPCYASDTLSSAALKIYTFYIRGYFCSKGVKECIWNALMHNVEDLKLQVSFTGICELPVRLFTCKALRSLELIMIPALSPSSSVSGFFMFPVLYMDARRDKEVIPNLRSQLRTLSLDHVTFPSLFTTSNMGFFPVIDFFSESYFPYLTRLSLTKCEGVDVLDINCPYLVYLDLNHTEIEKLILKTPRLLTLLVLRCFTEENEGVTLVDIWAPKLQVFQWKDNLVPSSFYIWDPKHVNTSEVSLLSLDVDEAMVESCTNLLSVLCMVKTFRIGDDFLVLLAKLDFYGIHTRLSKSLLELSLQTAMTKKSILGLWFLLRMSHALRYLDVLITSTLMLRTTITGDGTCLTIATLARGNSGHFSPNFKHPSYGILRR